jgi:hypothetical protein
MTRDDIIRLAEQAGIVFRLTSTDVTVEKLQRFLELAQASPHDDIIRLAREVWSAGDVYIGPSTESLERFAALVAAPLKEKIKDLEYQLKEARNE